MPTANLTRPELLEIAADYADFCVLVTSSDLEHPGPRVLYVNSAWVRMTGYTSADIIGRSPRILQGPETDMQLLGRLRTTLKSGKDFIARTTNYKNNGDAFQLEWVISHLKDAGGDTTHYIALQRDITGLDRAQHELARYDAELRSAQLKLLDATRQLESVESVLAKKARFSALGEIAAGVVHDLSNALTPVFGLVELLHSLDSLPDEARTMVGELDHGIEHALKLLSNLRDYHADGGARRALEPVDLNRLIQRIPDLTKGRWSSAARKPDAGIDFAFDLRDSAVVLGSDVEILQVLINLVLNAIDAMPDGGTITLGMMQVAGGRVNVTVSDTGVGMPIEMVETCFEPYVKGRSTGTGLGLSVCRRIVETHGGTIVAKLLADQGVSFQIDLPLMPIEVPTETDSN